MDEVQEAVAEALTCHGRIDVLVNNAGMVIEGMEEDFTDFAHMSEKDWDFGIAINLKTQFNVTRTVIGGMIERGYGRIVNVSSVTGPVVANPEESVYCAAKAGVLGMTRGIALDVAKHGITVNAVGPGWINTGSTTEGERAGGEEHALGPRRHAGRGRQAGVLPRLRRRELHHRPARGDRRRQHHPGVQGAERAVLLSRLVRLAAVARFSPATCGRSCAAGRGGVRTRASGGPTRGLPCGRVV